LSFIYSEALPLAAKREAKARAKLVLTCTYREYQMRLAAITVNRQLNMT
jgi:hypothetical protein